MAIGIFLRHGNYSHAIGECQVAMARRVERSADQRPVEIRESWDISGLLQGTSPSDLGLKIAALEDAYSRDGLDLGLYLNTNGTITETEHGVYSARTLRGVKVSPPSYPMGKGAEYATQRTYSIAAEWAYAAEGTSLLTWSQVIEQQGTGGPDWGYQIPLVGQPQQQLFTQRTTITVVQSGRAVGAGAYPTPPGPIYPAAELGKMRRISQSQPSLTGREREISWSYTFLFPGSVR